MFDIQVSPPEKLQRVSRHAHSKGEFPRDEHFRVHGRLVSTVGRDEETIRKYIRHQEHEDARLDQLNLWR